MAAIEKLLEPPNTNPPPNQPLDPRLVVLILKINELVDAVNTLQGAP